MKKVLLHIVKEAGFYLAAVAFVLAYGLICLFTWQNPLTGLDDDNYEDY